MTNPTPITTVMPNPGRPRARRHGQAHHEDGPWEREYGRDVWRLRELGIADRGIANISFTDIPQP